MRERAASRWHVSGRLGVLGLGVLLITLSSCEVLTGPDIVVEPVDLELDADEAARPDSPDLAGVATRLLSPGADPRETLRYTFELGTPERSTLTFRDQSSGTDYDGSRTQGSDSIELDVIITSRRKKGPHLVEFEAKLLDVTVEVRGSWPGVRMLTWSPTLTEPSVIWPA